MGAASSQGGPQAPPAAPEQQPRPRGAAADTTLLEVASLAKAFGETQALRDGSLAARPGSVHAILGENGSGKSTLVKILAGVLRPDSGEVTVAGARVEHFSPRALTALGTAAVLQEVLVAPNRSVLENVFLGHRSPLGRRAGRTEQRPLAQDALARLTHMPIGLDVPAGRLSLAQRQIVTIARALVREPRVLILDEATSAVGVDSRRLLFAEIERLKSVGVLIIFISHHLDEVLELSDEVTVLRSGASVATVRRGELRRDELLALMTPPVTRASLHAARPREAVAERPAAALPVLRASGLQLRHDAAPLGELIVRCGEIVGVAGLDGHGQEEFIEVLCGLRKPVAGSVRVLDEAGKERPVGGFREATRLGLAYLPRDRKTEGILPALSVLDNFAVALVRSGRATRLGFVRHRHLRERFSAARERLGIVAATPRAAITSLSGGNQQKVLLARWLALEPAVLLLNDPTRGVDAATKRTFYEIFRTTVEQEGRSIVLLSTDLEELSELCRRVLVFRRGDLVTELVDSAVTMPAILGAMFGERGGSAPSAEAAS